jgi:uncharacterized protein (DUF697 family)
MIRVQITAKAVSPKSPDQVETLVISPIQVGMLTSYIRRVYGFNLTVKEFQNRTSDTLTSPTGLTIVQVSEVND